jgi:hypothetical protein
MPTEWGCVSALSPDLFASCMLLHVPKAVSCARYTWPLSGSRALWMTNSVSLGSSLTFSSGPLTCSCLIDPPYFQAVFVKTWPTFLCINLRCHYYPDPHLRMLPLSTLWQTRDLGVTCCHSNRTISNNQSSASRRQSYLSLPSLPQTLMRHSIPSRSRCFFVSRTSGTPKI